VRDFRVTSRQRQRLQAALKSARYAAVVKRLVALLELDRGASVADTAVRLGVTRQTLYNWTRRFGADGDLGALHDRPRVGRAPKLSMPVRRLLVWLLGQPPDAFGYPSTGWTAPLLRRVLATHLGVNVSARTVRRALHQMLHTWKRPRYVLQPDPDREKKAPDPPTDPAIAPTQRHPRPGRNRPAPVPAPALRMGAAWRAGQGLAHRP
jgi:transposase